MSIIKLPVPVLADSNRNFTRNLQFVFYFTKYVAQCRNSALMYII